jgi:glycosyltransferase involved in cell wall biosynthesis
MKVLFLTIGDKSVASSRTRVYSYLPYLHGNGFKVFIMHYTPSWQSKNILSMKKQNFISKIISKLYSAGKLILLFIMAPFFDVVYIQKVALSKFAIAVLRVLNSNIIFDFDDAIFIHKDVTHLLRSSACVIVSNKYLKSFVSGHNERVYELISPVKVDSRAPLKKDTFITLGWSGSPQTSKYLYPLISVFKILKEKFENLNIEFMGAEKNRCFKALDIKITQWSIEGEKEYLRRMDIGIMPLTDDRFSQAKAGYKLLQYMAVGIPGVASPVGINRDIIKNGRNGFLAQTPNEWVDKLSLLIENALLRKRLGQQGRILAEKLYSYRVNAPRLIEILKSVTSGTILR